MSGRKINHVCRNLSLTRSTFLFTLLRCTDVQRDMRNEIRTSSSSNGWWGLGRDLSDLINKTKYFRLRLYYKVSKRPYSDLRQSYERKMKIQCFRQFMPNRRTDIVTTWAKKKYNISNEGRIPSIKSTLSISLFRRIRDTCPFWSNKEIS